MSNAAPNGFQPIAERLRAHVTSRGGLSKDADGNAVLPNGAWAMMIEAADRIEELEAALRKIQAKTEGERHTINEQFIFKYWGLLNLMMIEIRDIARAALPQSSGMARAERES